MSDESNPASFPINKETIDVLVTNVIPTTKYFEARFDDLQGQIRHMDNDIEKLDKRLVEFKMDVDKRFDDSYTYMNQRFDQVDKRFEQVDKRFEQVDKRFEQVDKRFEQIIFSIDKLTDKIEFSIDKLTDKIETKVEHQKDFTLRMFMISITISFVGVLGVLVKLWGVGIPA